MNMKRLIGVMGFGMLLLMALLLGREVLKPTARQTLPENKYAPVHWDDYKQTQSGTVTFIASASEIDTSDKIPLFKKVGNSISITNIYLYPYEFGFDVSADCQYVAYVIVNNDKFGSNALAVSRLTEEKPILTVNKGGGFYSPTISPESNWVAAAFTSNDIIRSLVVVNIHTGEFRPIFTEMTPNTDFSPYDMRWNGETEVGWTQPDYTVTNDNVVKFFATNIETYVTRPIDLETYKSFKVGPAVTERVDSLPGYVTSKNCTSTSS